MLDQRQQEAAGAAATITPPFHSAATKAKPAQDTKAVSRLQGYIDQVNTTLFEHIYSTEDTLYQIVFDKKYQPELYRLKTEVVDGRQGAELAKRYQEVQQKYRQRRLDRSFHLD